ncbi:hypothetical protein KKD19_00550 [Patescibacteria group bacterium]|nr:hypothetical protein [Patescibacteria group bacterium]
MSLSKIAKCSHDSLTRVLNGQNFCWQILLQNFILRTFGKPQDGYLMIDDTIISKLFAKRIENLAWKKEGLISHSITCPKTNDGSDFDPSFFLFQLKCDRIIIEIEKQEIKK